ncbi:MAG: hypothetical protein ACOH2H_04155 [Cypionkella sp.]
MLTRLRLFQASTALLYLGPLLAGLAGQGWAMIPLFAVLFVLWSVILRPHLWPASLKDFARAADLVAIAALVATQVLLVTVCFAIGRGIGGVMGVSLQIPVYLPAALSFLSIPLSRLVWRPDQIETLAGFDPLMHKPGTPEPLAPAALAETMLEQVLALPDDIGEDDLQAHLTAISGHVDALLIRRTLENAIAGPRRTKAGLKALILHATDPDIADLLSGSAYPAQAFTAAQTDPDLLELFATRCARMLEDKPHLAPDCPPIPALTQAAQTATPAVRDALQRLTGLLLQTSPPDPQP